MSSAKRSTLEQCALTSGLLTAEQLGEVRCACAASDAVAGNGQPDDEQLAKQLIELGWLNPWQACQLLDGRTKFTLGPYRIFDSLGQGGMGQVFKAEHSSSGRIVAVKVLPKAKSTPEAILSFQNEIRSLGRLDHPKLVRALDFGHDGSVNYLVTEYVPGSDLRKLVRRDGPLDMEPAARIIYQVADGLSHAHARGLIHRDVKPGNVLVTPDGEAKLSDLGLAGPMAGDAEKDPRFGKIVGTADYLSPDHIKAPWDPQPAWDIYSLGCTLYYAATGKVPFPGGTTADKARAHCELRPLDPRRLNPNLGAEFVDLMADMMAKDPAQRICTTEEVMLRLLPWIKTPLPDSTKASDYPPFSLEQVFAPIAAPPNGRRPLVPGLPVARPGFGESPAEPTAEGGLSDTMGDSDEQVVISVVRSVLSPSSAVPLAEMMTEPPAPAPVTPPPISTPLGPIAAPPVVRPVATVGDEEKVLEYRTVTSFWQRHRLPILVAIAAVPALVLFAIVIFALVQWLAG